MWLGQRCQRCAKVSGNRTIERSAIWVRYSYRAENAAMRPFSSCLRAPARTVAISASTSSSGAASIQPTAARLKMRTCARIDRAMLSANIYSFSPAAMAAATRSLNV